MRIAMCGIAGAFVLCLTGCSGDNAFCGANAGLAYVCGRPDTSPTTAPPGYTVPSSPAAPGLAPTAQISFSPSSPRKDQAVTFTGTWSDSDGHVAKFEWDLDSVTGFEVSGTP